MSALPAEPRLWSAPLPQVGADVEAFLRMLGGPAVIHVRGRDPRRRRVVSTLLHGNEPSGTHAIRRFLAQGIEPAVDLCFVIASVEAALLQPAFSHRMLPGGRDQNRCFRPPFAGLEGARAERLLAHMLSPEPEALVDVHNTSGRGPTYAVSLGIDSAHRVLAACYGPRIIHTQLQLGTLMEASEPVCPTVTIECGGAADPQSHERAFRGLCRLAELEDLAGAPAPQLTLLRDPVRIELAEGASVAFAAAPVAGCDVTLPADIESRNFGILAAGEPVGWLGERGLDALRAVDPVNGLGVEALFEQRADRLVAARALEPLMVTTDPDIARSDCLFYLVPV